MGIDFAKLNRCLLVAGLVLTAACSAEAQHAGRGPGDAILFSSPEDGSVSSNLPSLSAKPPDLLDLANPIQSPGAKLGAASQSGLSVGPPPPAATSAAQPQQMRQLFDERGNWALMTPEQILGLPTQKKILGVPERDALDQPDSDVMAQFLGREERTHVHTNEANSGAALTVPQTGLSDTMLPMNQNLAGTPVGVNPASPSLLSQFFNGVTNRPAGLSDQTSASDWPGSFNRPTPAANSASAQSDALAGFQPLFQPDSSSGDNANASVFGGSSLSPIFSTPAAPARTAAATPALAPAISVGAFYAPLNSLVMAPARAAPLPGLFGPTNVAPVSTPAWKPQAPPWESSAPELGKVPQRKF